MVLKRGVFFTLTSILFIAVLIILFSSDKRAAIIHTDIAMVKTTDAFRVQLENRTLPILIRQHSYQTFYDLSADAYKQNVYPLVLPADFSEAMRLGTYGSGAHVLPAYQTLPQALSELETAASGLGYDANFSLVSATVGQTGAFQAAYTVVIDFNLSNADSSVFYMRSLTIQDVFVLDGIDDLYYNTNQRPLGWTDVRTFKQFRTKSWNNTEFAAFATSRGYTPDNDSPSIFGRLTGTLVPSVYGVTTLINVTIAPPSNLTSFDWQYFAAKEFSCTYKSPAYNPFAVPISAVAIYNLTGTSHVYDYGGCPNLP